MTSRVIIVHKKIQQSTDSKLIIAIELLIEWTEQIQRSSDNSTTDNTVEYSLETNLLEAPDVATILKISKSAAYRLIQLGQTPSVRINSSIRVKPADFHDFFSRNLG